MNNGLLFANKPIYNLTNFTSLFNFVLIEARILEFDDDLHEKSDTNTYMSGRAENSFVDPKMN